MGGQILRNLQSAPPPLFGVKEVSTKDGKVSKQTPLRKRLERIGDAWIT